MILLVAVGWALQQFAGVPNALLFGLLAGLLAAPFVPAASCGVRLRGPRRSAE